MGKRDTTGTRMALGEGAMGRVARTREPLIIDNYQEWVGRSPQYAQVDFHAVMVAPLLIGGRLVGAIAFMDRDPTRRFGADDLRLLNLFAPQAAIAIENARSVHGRPGQRQYFAELVSNSPVAIVTLDVHHNVVSCNPAFESCTATRRPRSWAAISTTSSPPRRHAPRRSATPSRRSRAGRCRSSASGAARTAAWWMSRCWGSR